MEEVLRAIVYFVLEGGMNAVMAVLMIGTRTACCRMLVRQLLLFCEYCSSSSLASILAENNSCIGNGTAGLSGVTRFRRTYDACPCQSQHLTECTCDSNVSDGSAKSVAVVL